MGTSLAINLTGITLTQRHCVPSFVLPHGCRWFVNLRHSLADASGYLLVAAQRMRGWREGFAGSAYAGYRGRATKWPARGTKIGALAKF